MYITLVYFAMNILLNQNFQLKQDSALKLEIVQTHAASKNAYLITTLQRMLELTVNSVCGSTFWNTLPKEITGAKSIISFIELHKKFLINRY